jgi:spore maturation protein CgeB
MKVFFIGAESLDAMRGDTMEAHVVAGLETLGAEVRYFPFLAGGPGRRLNRLLEIAMTDYGLLRSTPVERAMLRALAGFRPDLVLVLLGNYTSPATVRKIRAQTGAPLACWCQDHMGTMGRQYLIGAGFDYVFAKDQAMVDLFRRFTGLKEVHYLPEACNPAVHRTAAPTPGDIERFGCDITTAATLYYYRAEILQALIDYDLRVWGPVPRFYDGPLRGLASGASIYTRDKAACFGAARIVVNTLFPLEFGGLNARAFEVAGCGGFQLITHCEAVARHFEPGREIETFRDLAELRVKVDYFLAHDDERRAIAAAGQRRAHAEHTYRHRLQQMLNIMKLT